MKLSCLALALLLAGCAVPSHDAPSAAAMADEMSSWQPEAQTPQHKWLMRAVGSWESVGTMEGGDGAPMEMRSTESVRAVGDYWIVNELDADMFGMPFRGVMTLGFDPKAGHFVGTWLDSTNSMLWHYTGKLDPAGNTLTLDTEGPLPWAPERNGKYRESLEITGPDSKVFTSTVQQDDGTWMQIMRVESKRKG